MGDFVKGKGFEAYPDKVQLGILLHREIDSFTDKHAIVRQSKSRLKEKYRHYSGVIVDVFYDHFLAKNFEQFSTEPLDDFVQQQYRNLENNYALLPAKAQAMLPYMVRGNWLANYKEERGIQKSLQGMSRRTKFDSKMDEAIIELKAFKAEFEADFLSFFPILIAHSTQFREDLLISQS